MGKVNIDWATAKRNKKKIFIDSRGNQFNSFEELKTGKHNTLSKENQIKALEDKLNKLKNE